MRRHVTINTARKTAEGPYRLNPMNHQNSVIWPITFKHFEQHSMVKGLYKFSSEKVRDLDDDLVDSMLVKSTLVYSFSTKAI